MERERFVKLGAIEVFLETTEDDIGIPEHVGDGIGLVEYDYQRTYARPGARLLRSRTYRGVEVWWTPPEDFTREQRESAREYLQGLLDGVIGVFTVQVAVDVEGVTVGRSDWFGGCEDPDLFDLEVEYGLLNEALANARATLRKLARYAR